MFLSRELNRAKTGRPMPPSPLRQPAIAACLAVLLLAVLSAHGADRLVLDEGNGLPGSGEQSLTGVSQGMPSNPGQGLSIDEGNGFTNNLGSFDIVINPGATLAGNSAALAAFERAAAQWESFFSDPITVNIDADLQSLGSSTIIGQASSEILQGTFNEIRDAMVLDSSFESDDGIVASLPTSAQFTGSLPAGFSFDGNISINKANAKALGFPDLDADFGPNDATITFNSDFSFDYDNANGVTSGQVDFETVAAHEIGHALGFTSEVDRIDVLLDMNQTASTIRPRTVDLFRFEDGSAEDPDTALDFTTAERFLQTGGTPIFDEIIEVGISGAEGLLSTGAETGDGRQASHWKDNNLTGNLLGIMDPTLPTGTIVPISLADVRVLDLVGYDFIPEPSSALLLIGALGLMGIRRRAKG